MDANKDVYCQDCAKNPKVDCEVRGCQRKVILEHDKLPLCAFCSKNEFCKGTGCQRILVPQDGRRPLRRECHQKSVEVPAGNKACAIAQEEINQQRRYRFEQARWKKAQQQRQYSDRKNENMLREDQPHPRPPIVGPPPRIRFQEENIRPRMQHRSQSPAITAKEAASALARSTALSQRQQKSTRSSRQHGVVIGKMGDDSDDNSEMPEIEQLTTNRRRADEEVERRRRADWNRSLNYFVEGDTPSGGRKSSARESHQQQKSKKPTVPTKHRLGIALPISTLDNYEESRASQSPIRGVRANNANVVPRTPVLGRKLPTAFVRRVQEKSRKSDHRGLARAINRNQQDSRFGDDDGFAPGFEDDFMDSATTPTPAAVTIANRATFEDEDRDLFGLKLNCDYGGPKTRPTVGGDDSEDPDTEVNHGNTRRKRRRRASKRYGESESIDEPEDNYHSRLAGSYWGKDKQEQSLRLSRDGGIDSDGDQPRRSQRDRRAKPPQTLPPPKLTKKRVSKKQLHNVKKRQRVEEPETPKLEGSAIREVDPALREAPDSSKCEKVFGKKEAEVQLEDMGYYVPKNVMERVLAHPEEDEDDPRTGIKSCRDHFPYRPS